MAKICISQNQALEERLSNMHEQMAGVTSRLDQTERDLDLERATREDIIKAYLLEAHYSDQLPI